MNSVSTSFGSRYQDNFEFICVDDAKFQMMSVLMVMAMNWKSRNLKKTKNRLESIMHYWWWALLRIDDFPQLDEDSFEGDLDSEEFEVREGGEHVAQQSCNCYKYQPIAQENWFSRHY